MLESDADDGRLRFLMAHDRDPFVRWESGQSYALQLMLGADRGAARGARRWRSTTGLAEAFAATLADPRLEPAFVAQALSLPSESYVGEQMAEIDVDGVHAVARVPARGARPRASPRPGSQAYRALAERASPTASRRPRSAGGRCATSRSAI